jgi:ribosomal protein S18 acetylase RimI-like enzyme
MDADLAPAIADGRVEVAEGDGVVVGLMVLQPHRDHVLVENLAVDPSSQGRGVGRALLRHAEDRAIRLGVHELRLFTHVAMTENRAFYARRGFRETDRRIDSGIERVFFAKRLASRSASTQAESSSR